LVLAALLGAGPAQAQTAANQVERHKLQNDKLSYSFTTGLGGRGLGFAAAGMDNLLKVGEAVRDQPAPQVTADAGFIPYFGHIVWPGPQGDWWRQQSVNPKRRAAKAVWPPDPFTVLSEYDLAEISDTSAKIVSPVSPVTGLQLTKEFTLEDEMLLHRVTAVNRRDTPVKWDIWFNTRVGPDAHIYVPVADFDGDLRLEKFPEMAAEAGAAPEKRARGFFDFARGKKIKAKAFIQPAAGWFAVFTRGQLFAIEFPLLPRDAIHPDQGQVELYLETDPAEPGSGVLELEVHGPYRTLATGESMVATEKWRAVAYTGEDTLEGHLQALRQLGLGTL